MFSCANLQIYDEIFTDLDVDKSGKIDLTEFHTALTALGVDVDAQYIKRYMQLLGYGDTLELGREQFKKLLFAFENADGSNAAELLFFACDEDYSGNIDGSEFGNIMRKLFPTLKDEITAQVMKILANKENQITYQVFMDFIKEVYK